MDNVKTPRRLTYRHTERQDMIGDNGGLDIRPGKPNQPDPVSDTLTIRRTRANGHVQVSGPLDDRGLCYLLMEMARDVIQERHMKAKQGHPSQQPPDGKPRERKKFGD